MKASNMNHRPDYELMKQSDIVSFYHLQFPRWLLEDSRYRGMSLEAKFIYMLLFNRFQLSKHNGWINDNGEVFIIYTREELAGKLGVSEKRVTAAMNELKGLGLIWERRCGRGFANQIYLASVKISEKDAINSSGGPMDLRNDETAVLENTENTDEPVQEPPNYPFKTRQNVVSETAVSTVQEPPELRPSYLDFKNNRFDLEFSQSIESEGLTEDGLLERIIAGAELDGLNSDEARVIRGAVERLFFSENYRVDGAVYPQSMVRLRLTRLDFEVARDALFKLSNNSAKIKNSGAYATAVLFNAIIEADSDLLVDPYLNSLRHSRLPQGVGVT